MPKIVFEGQEYESQTGESVLDCLTRYGVSVDYACKAGVCQTCMMVAQDGTPSPESQVGLKETLRAQNYFLICSCVPEQNLTVSRPNSGDTRVETRVSSVDQLNPEVVRLRLERPDKYEYLPGQFLNLTNDQGVVRSYSLASVPQLEDYLELHIRRVAGGQVSTWVADRLQTGDQVTISPATGKCAYVGGRPEQSLLLVGTGTGLAPLYGIARDALQQGHTGPIHLYHGSTQANGLYLVEELAKLAEQYPQFHYHACVSREKPTGQLRQGRATELALSDHPNLAGWRVFLCGNEDMVKGMQKKVFLAGASMQDIFADPFLKS